MSDEEILGAMSSERNGDGEFSDESTETSDEVRMERTLCNGTWHFSMKNLTGVREFLGREIEFLKHGDLKENDVRLYEESKEDESDSQSEHACDNESKKAAISIEHRYKQMTQRRERRYK